MIFSVERIKRSKIYKNVQTFCNSYLLVKMIGIAIIWIIAFIPVYIYLFVRWMFGPVGFWQELATLAACFVGIGWLQGILAFFAVILTGSFLSE